ncbi:MAG TPA: class I SAM-dependent methyltransferase [Ilumatobacter sp.]|nr:class I SAM-dependent methyltransferase [Ilumatobacter sp.]
MLSQVPRRYLVAVLAVTATSVLAMITVACILLAVDTDGAARAGFALLAAAGSIVTAASVAGIFLLPRLRRIWIRNRRARRRTLDDLARLRGADGGVAGARAVRGVNDKATQAVALARDLQASVARLETAMKSVPDVARLHRLLDVTSQQTRSLVQREADATRKEVGTSRTEILRVRKEGDAAQRESARRFDRVERVTAEQMRHLYGHVDGLAALYTMLGPAQALPPLLADWAVGADLGAHLVRHVLRERPAAIVELGSGVSTVLLAMAARQAGHGHVTSVEHDQQYALRTEQMLREFGVTEYATVQISPLVPTVVGDETYSWYDLAQMTLPATIDLLIVDGPPGRTGPMARFPAVPQLRDRFARDCVVVLDDARRDDEVRTIDRWLAEYDLKLTGGVRFMTGTAELVPSDATTSEITHD